MSWPAFAIGASIGVLCVVLREARRRAHALDLSLRELTRHTTMTIEPPRVYAAEVGEREGIPLTRSPQQLTAELAAALGVPKHTRKAVLVLEAGKDPMLHLHVNATLIRDGQRVVQLAPSGDRIRQVRFAVRLVPLD